MGGLPERDAGPALYWVWAVRGRRDSSCDVDGTVDWRRGTYPMGALFLRSVSCCCPRDGPCCGEAAFDGVDADDGAGGGALIMWVLEIATSSTSSHDSSVADRNDNRSITLRSWLSRR